MGAFKFDEDLLVKVTCGEGLVVPPGTLPRLIFLGETLTFGSLRGDKKSWARATLPTENENAQVRIATAATRPARRFKISIVFTKMC